MIQIPQGGKFVFCFVLMRLWVHKRIIWMVWVNGDWFHLEYSNGAKLEACQVKFWGDKNKSEMNILKFNLNA